jgi:hypothetical protein
MDYTTLTSDEILEKLAKTQTLYVLIGYDPSYEFLTNNWKKICDYYQVAPQSLVLMELAYVDLPNAKDSTDMINMYDELTKRGYCIRRLYEFIPCKSMCGYGIVDKNYFETVKTRWNFLPSTWNEKCSSCLKK